VRFLRPAECEEVQLIAKKFTFSFASAKKGPNQGGKLGPNSLLLVGSRFYDPSLLFEENKDNHL